MRSISSFERRPLSLVMTILLVFPVPFSRAENVHDSVGIKIEGNLDLWDTTRRRWNTSELELAQKVVVLSSLTLAFKYLNEHTRLVVGKCRENFGLLGWDGGVSWDKLGHLSTGGLDTKGKWRNIEEENFVGALG